MLPRAPQLGLDVLQGEDGFPGCQFGEHALDGDFRGQKSKKAIYDAQHAKFTQNEELKALLLATNDAKLVHFVKGVEPDVFDELMLVRDKIRREKIV